MIGQEDLNWHYRWLIAKTNLKNAAKDPANGYVTILGKSNVF